MRPNLGTFGQQVAPPADISSTSLVGYWKLNENTGTSAASETGNHTGTLIGTPTWVAGKSGSGVQFNGTSQYIDVTTSAGLNMTTNAISLMAWINPDVTTSSRRIICHPWTESGGWEKYALIINAGTLQFWLAPSSTETSTSTAFTTTGSWSHVCAVYNGTDMRLYINGSLVGTPLGKTGNIVSSTNGNFQIGRFGPTWGQYFDGIIDEVRVYSRAISAAEVSTVYSLG